MYVTIENKWCLNTGVSHHVAISGLMVAIAGVHSLVMD